MDADAIFPFVYQPDLNILENQRLAIKLARDQPYHPKANYLDGEYSTELMAAFFMETDDHTDMAHLAFIEESDLQGIDRTVFESLTPDQQREILRHRHTLLLGMADLFLADLASELGVININQAAVDHHFSSQRANAYAGHWDNPNQPTTSTSSWSTSPPSPMKVCNTIPLPDAALGDGPSPSKAKARAYAYARHHPYTSPRRPRYSR